MSEHNETPWYANGPAVYMGADGGFGLRCCPNPEANARHIVHCVNNYNEMVEALKNALLILEDSGKVGISYQIENLLDKLGEKKLRRL